MTAQTPASERPSSATARPDRPPGALRVLGLAAIGFGVAALAVATFVLSYSAIHVLALQAGVTPRLARGYPLLIDAMLVIVLAAVLGLRGAGLPSRLLAWATLLAVLAAAATADALHAAGQTLPARGVEIGAAVLPWVLVLLAFALLLAMLRHARLRRETTATPFADRADTLAEITDTSIDADGLGSAITEPAITVSAETEVAASEPAASVLTAVPDDAEPAETDEPADPDMPVFHRMWSSPTPPASNQ